MKSASSADKKLIVLMALWNQYHRHGDATERRDARLHYLSALLGRRIASAKDLTPPELRRAIDSIQSALPAGQRRPSRNANVVSMPNRNVISREQVWKIRQVEKWMGWDTEPKRLAGFLIDKYRCRRPEEMTHKQAWSCIESLFRVAARNAVKARLGASHAVSRQELIREVTALKQTLHWRPPAP